MKELLCGYAAYNVWANSLMVDAMLRLGDGMLDTEVVSSFPSLRATVYHIWSAEYIWLQRLQLAEHPVWMAGEFSGTFTEACTHWQGVSRDLLHFVEKQYDDKALAHILQFYDRQKVSHKMPVYQVVQHVINHGSYHRGQLVTIMRQLGVKDIPGTDFILFARKN